MQTITVQVAEEDIANGERANCELCPIKLALHRLMDANSISVWNRCVDIFFTKPKWACLRIELPDAVRNFIKSFDAMYPVAPFSFDLKIPD